jgi:TP901-1 family phage major tail protein
MSTFIKGDNVILSIWDSVSEEYEPIGCLTSNEISFSREVIEAKTKCDAGEVVRDGGSVSYELSFEGVDIEIENEKMEYNSLLFYISNANMEKLTWRLSTGVTPAFRYGTAVLTELTQTAPTDDNVTFSGTLSGSGVITTTDPKA